jgi:DNA invertase Pin-like site-specific DNA recombinase
VRQPACLAVEHLFLGTPRENTDDARAKGRLRWRSSRLSPVLAGEIKRRIQRGEGASKIAREMGVSLHSVQNVKGGRAWRDVPANPPSRDSAGGELCAGN